MRLIDVNELKAKFHEYCNELFEIEDIEKVIDLTKPVETISQWVRVSDTKKYPKHEKTYIVNLKRIVSGKCENAFAKYDCDLDVWQLCDEYGTLFGSDGTTYYSPEMNAELTHWMEQPKPPMEEEK